MFLFLKMCGGKHWILTQGRIILWAGGSLADDGSTVSKQVFLYSSVWMKICVHILNNVWKKALNFDTRQNNPVGLPDDGSTVSKQVFLYSTVSGWKYMFLFLKICGGKHLLLTQGRIILWARGSLADDGSTVKTSVPILNSFWKKIYVPILKNVWRKALNFDTRQNNPVGRR